MKVDLKTFAQVRRHGSQWAAEHFGAEGAIDVPTHARWDSKAGTFTWREAHHVTSADCPRCMSATPCMQELTLFFTHGHLTVVHEADALDETPAVPLCFSA